jgi:formiminotetrahydrofolate cyclodeaminase
LNQIHLVPSCSIQLRQAQKECDEVKQLYIEVCGSKETLIATLESEQRAKRELTSLLDEDAERFKKIKMELDAEKRKVWEEVGT